MINRAKCKLCLSTIESHLPDEIVYCRCGEIAVCDGAAMRMWPFGSVNFVRVDDLGNEVIVKHKNEKSSENTEPDTDNPSEKITRSEAITGLEEIINSFRNLPEHAKYSSVTHKDFIDFMLIISTILKIDKD